MPQVPYNPNIIVAGPQAAPPSVSLSQEYTQMAQPKSAEFGARRRRRRSKRSR